MMHFTVQKEVYGVLLAHVKCKLTQILSKMVRLMV